MSSYCNVCEESTIEDEEIETAERKKSFVIIIVSGFILFFSITFDLVLQAFILGQILAALVALISGYEIVIKGFKNLLEKKITINLLMTIATVGSFIIGHGGEGATLMFLFFIAEFLEDYAKDRSKKSITSLMKIAPDSAIVEINGLFKELHTHDVQKGEIVRVKPGETIPLDGVIIMGETSINEASLTGESVPVYRKIGDDVFAGTINNEGFLRIRVTKTSDQTFIAKVKDLIEEAKNQKSSTEQFIDVFAKYYTPIMILLAAVVMIIPPLFFQQPIYDWVYRGLILLVISCPCALALATPITVVSALHRASKNGILIKGGKFLEETKKIKTIAFDKTGTLTEGTLEIADIFSFDGEFNQWLRITAGLEKLSEHPISKAIVKGAEARDIKPVEIKSFKSISGRGITGDYNNQQYYLGNKALFQELNITVPIEKIDSYTGEGKTVVIFGTNQSVIGLITLRDRIRKEAKKVINDLKNRNLHTILISGDNYNTVKATQKALEIDEIYFELKPDEKQEIIREKASDGSNIAMVGDGVNDAPSLALANVGIAMGGIGSDVSLETADVVLMQDNLEGIPLLIDISKKSNLVVKQNIYIALFVKLFFVFLTFFGFMTLYIAVGIGDLGVTLFVIFNAFRLLRFKIHNNRSIKKKKSIF